MVISSDGVNFQISKKTILKRDKRLGPNKAGVGGLPGLSQDVFIVEIDGGKRLFYWSAGDHGIYSAFNDLSVGKDQLDFHRKSNLELTYVCCN